MVLCLLTWVRCCPVIWIGGSGGGWSGVWRWEVGKGVQWPVSQPAVELGAKHSPKDPPPNPPPPPLTSNWIIGLLPCKQEKTHTHIQYTQFRVVVVFFFSSSALAPLQGQQSKWTGQSKPTAPPPVLFWSLRTADPWQCAVCWRSVRTPGMRSSLVCSLSAEFHARHVLVCFLHFSSCLFYTDKQHYVVQTIFYLQDKSGFNFYHFSSAFLIKHWFSCYFDSDYLAHLLQWLPPVEHCQPPWLLTLVFCKCLMKCTSFGWSPACWPQIQCVSSFRECGDVAAIGRLCHSDSVRWLRWSSFFPLSHPWRATTGPEHHGEN